MRNRENGFSLIEVVSVILALTMIGIIGWTAYKNHHKSAATPDTSANVNKSIVATATPTAVTDPYATWKSYSSGYEGLSFKYPPNWALSVQPEPVSNGNVNNGNVLSLTSPAGFVVKFEAPDQNQGGGCTTGINTVVQVARLNTTSNNALYMVIVNHSGFDDLGIYDFVDAKHTLPEVGETLCNYYPAFTGKAHLNTSDIATNLVSFYSKNNISMPTDQYLALPDVKTAQLVFESLKY